MLCTLLAPFNSLKDSLNGWIELLATHLCARGHVCMLVHVCVRARQRAFMSVECECKCKCVSE